MSIQKGHRVEVLRDITRAEGPYAQKGEQGEVVDTFLGDVQSGGAHKKEIDDDGVEVFRVKRGFRRWNAKVKMDDGKIKTFRLTSLGRINAPE